jgi:hypothetical protein
MVSTSMQKAANKGRLTVQQKEQTFLFVVETRSVLEMQRRFCARFGMQWAPAAKSIHRLHQKFQQDGTVLEKKHKHATSVHSPQNIEGVTAATQRSPGKTTWKAAAEL